jgi:hypothetical protein
MPGTTSSTDARATNVAVTDDELSVQLADGRTIGVPLVWYPRLLQGTVGERDEWSLIGEGRGIHWPQLDEDVAIDDLLAGRPSGESQTSLKRWLESRE